MGEPWALPVQESKLSTFLSQDQQWREGDAEVFLSGQIPDAQSRMNVMNLIEDGKTGFLVPGRDVSEFARFTRRLLDDSLLAISMGTAAAHRAQSYSWKSAALKARSVYTELLERDLVACS